MGELEMPGPLSGPLVPGPAVAILRFTKSPVVHAPLQVSVEEFPGDVPGLPGHSSGTEFSTGPGEAFVKFLREPCFQGIGSFPASRNMARGPAASGPGRIVLTLFPDILAPFAAEGIEKAVYLVAGTERTAGHGLVIPA